MSLDNQVLVLAFLALWVRFITKGSASDNLAMGDEKQTQECDSRELSRLPGELKVETR